MPKVSIPQKNLVLECKSGDNLMDVLIAGELPVASSCLGEGICSKCKVKVSPIGNALELELKTMTRNKIDSQSHRLSCQVFIETDLVVTTTYW